MRRLPPRSLALLALAAVLALGTARAIAGDLAALHRRASRPEPAAARAGVPRPPGPAVPAAGPGGARRRPEPASGTQATTSAVPPGMRAVRIGIEPPWALPAGAVVDVLGLDGQTVAAGAVVLREENRREASNPAEATLLVTVDAARRVVSTAAAGPLAVALAPPEDACCRTSSSGSSRD